MDPVIVLTVLVPQICSFLESFLLPSLSQVQGGAGPDNNYLSSEPKLLPQAKMNAPRFRRALKKTSEIKVSQTQS